MYPLKLSSLTERKEFYEKEFSITSVDEWLKKINFYPQFFVIDAGTETKIIKDKKRANKLIIFKPNLDLKTLRYKLIKYLPEDVYLDRNIYVEPDRIYKRMDFRRVFGTQNCNKQLLAFDIDSGNIKCRECRDMGFLYLCLNCFIEVKKRVISAYKILKTSFKSVECVYSGRGFHLYVIDKRAVEFSVKDRESINKRMRRFAIDPWVSRGYIRLMRLPYTLNSLVSRIAIPIPIKEITNFDLRSDKKVIPKFLLSKSN